METTEVVCRLAYGFSWPMRTATASAADVRAAEQLEQDHVLLERLEHRADAQREVGADAREVGRAGEDDPLLTLLDEGVVERAHDGAHEVAVRGLELLGQRLQGGRGVDEALAHRLRVDLARTRASSALRGR